MNEIPDHPSITTIRYTEKIILQCVIMFRICEKSLHYDLHPVVKFNRRAGVFANVFSAALDEFQKENPGVEAALHFPYAISEIIFCLQNIEETEKLVTDNSDYGVPVAGLGMMAIQAYRKLDVEEGKAGPAKQNTPHASVFMGPWKNTPSNISLPAPTLLPSSSKPSPEIPRLSADD